MTTEIFMSMVGLLCHLGGNNVCVLHFFQDLATPEAFESNPSLVWEFYHYRREVMATKQPNKVSLYFHHEK